MSIVRLQDTGKKELLSKFETSDLEELYFDPVKFLIFSFSDKEDIYVKHGIYDDRRIKNTASLHVEENNIIFSKSYKKFSIGGISYVIFLESLFIVKNNMLATYPPPQSYFHLYNEDYRSLIKEKINCPELDEILSNHDQIQ